jgi:hypothetical protein
MKPSWLDTAIVAHAVNQQLHWDRLVCDHVVKCATSHHAYYTYFHFTCQLLKISTHDSNAVWMIEVSVIIQLDIIRIPRHLSDDLKVISWYSPIEKTTAFFHATITEVIVVNDESAIMLVYSPIHGLASRRTIPYEIASIAPLHIGPDPMAPVDSSWAYTSL